MSQTVMSNELFLDMQEEDLMYLEAGGLLNDIAKGVTSVLGGAVVKSAVSGAISGSVGGPVGTVSGIVAGVVISYAWDKAF